MDSTNSSNPSPSLPTQHIPTSTRAPNSNSVQNLSVSINVNAAECQPSSTLTSFVIPTLSLVDWAQTQQIFTSDPLNPISQPALILVMATPNPPQKKQRERQKPPTLLQKSKALQ
ncbi:hypothetical protein DFH28DRAFT_1117367 [Melampsora americana]|nr:hypothetical protein DFH28DRAFT_1117367 [Melampsora americana]